MPFSLTDFIGDRLNSYGLDVERRDQPHRTHRRRPGPVQIVLPQRGRGQGRAKRQDVTFEDSSGDKYEVAEESSGRARNRRGSWDSSSREYIPGYYGRGVGARGSGRSQGLQQHHESRHSPTHSYSPYENVNVETRSSLARPSTSGYPSSSSRSYSYSPYEGVNVETRSPHLGQSSYRSPRPHFAPDHTLAYAAYCRENPYAGDSMEERVPYEHQRNHESRHQPRERDTRRIRFTD
jgi:hypothetical protein